MRGGRGSYIVVTDSDRMVGKFVRARQKQQDLVPYVLLRMLFDSASFCVREGAL